MSLETKIIAAIRQAVDDSLIVAESEDDGGDFITYGQTEFINRLTLDLSTEEREELFSEWIINLDGIGENVPELLIRNLAPVNSARICIALADKLLSHYQEHADQRLNELEKGL